MIDLSQLNVKEGDNELLQGLTDTNSAANILTPAEQEYATDISNTLTQDSSRPITNTSEWVDLNNREAQALLDEEYEGMLLEDLDNIASGVAGAKDVSKNAIAYSLLRSNLMNQYFDSAAAVSAARQMGAEALAENPSLSASGIKMLQEQDFYAQKNAVLENHIKMAQANLDNSSFMTKVKGVITDWTAFPGWFDVYSKQEALKALGRKDASWFGRKENMNLFYDMVMTAHKDRGVSPLIFDKMLTSFEVAMKEAGVNPYQTSVLEDYLRDYDPGLQDVAEVLDYGALIGGAAKGAVKGAIGATKGIAAAPGMLGAKGIKGASKAALTAYEGAKGFVVGVGESLPLGEYAAGKATQGVDVLLKGRINGLSKASKLMAVGNERRLVNAVRELVGDPKLKSTKALKMLNEYAFPGANKPVMFNADETVWADKGIQTEMAHLAHTYKVIMRASSNLHFDDLMGGLWEKTAKTIADSLEDTGYVEKILPSKAGYRDIMQIVEPIASTKDNNIIARIKLDVKGKKLKSQMKLSKTKEGIILGAEDPALEEARTIAANIVKDYKDNGLGKIKIIPYKDNGEWKLQAEVATNKGWSTLYRESPAYTGKANEFRGFLSSLFTYSSNPTDIQQLNILRALAATPLRETEEAVMKGFKALNKEDKDLLEKLTQMSIHYQAFYTPEHLLGRGVSQDVVNVYSNWRTFNDLDYFVRNRATRDYLVGLGIKDLTFNGKYIGRGRVLPLGQKSDLLNKVYGTGDKPGRKYLLVNSTDINNIKELSKDVTRTELEGYFDAGYRLVETLHAPDDFHDARQIYYLFDGNGLVENDLGEFVTQYLAGGRRFFDRSGGFVKQIRLEDNLNGRKVITGVSTFGADADYVGLTRRTAQIEEIRKAYAKGQLLLVDKLIRDSDIPKGVFHESQSFAAWANHMGIDIKNVENALEVVKDGRILSSYDKLVSAGAFDTLGPEEMYNMVHRSAFQSLTNEGKLAKLRRTGRELFAWDLSVAQPVDFEHQMRYMVNDMVHTGVMPYFTKFYADRFAQEFKTVIQNAGVMTPEEMLVRGSIMKGLDGAAAKLARAAQTAQANYRAIRGVPSEFDQKVADVLSNVIGSIAGKGQEWLKISEDTAHGIRLKWNRFLDMDPLNCARALTSHWYLGLFNVSQLYKQWVSDFAVFAMDPAAAMHAAKYHIPFTTALYKSDGNLEKAMKILAEKFGDKPLEVQRDFENLIKMGAFTHGTAGGFIDSKETVKSLFNKISYAPFSFGEMANRVKAYLAALYSKGYHGQKLTSQQLAEVTDYAQRLFLNMDSTGLSRLQIGTFGKTFMQYMGYRMRWLETVLFDRELTKAQRARLAVANALLVGGEGMVGIKTYDALSNVFAGDQSDVKIDPEDASALKTIAAQGLLNWASEETGLGVNFSNILDLSYGDLVDDMLDVGGYNIPAVTFVSNALKATADIGKEINKMVFDEYTPQDFSNFLQIMARSGELPPSVARPYLGYLAWKTGNEFNSRGQLVSRDNTALQAFLKGIGLTSKEIQDVYRARLQQQSANKRVSDFKKELEPIFNQTYREGGAATEATLQLMLRTSGLPAQEVGRVVKDLMHQYPNSIGATRIEQAAKDQLKRNGFSGSELAIKYLQDNKEGGQ